MIPVKHFYMIRHGETEANAARIMAGAMDSPLTDKGKDQARAVQHAVKALKIKPKRIIHSNLSRARDTAHIINQTLNLPIHEDKDVAEMFAGDWEGASYRECEALFKGWVDPPNGETCAAFFDRIKQFKIKALNKNDPIMIVSHGGVFRAFYKLYGIHTEGVQNCKLYEFIPKKQTNDIFPWDVWRYDTYDDVQRVLVNLEAHPAAEILL